MSRLPDLCSDAALRILRFTIQEAQGNEVFFLGTTDETGVIQEVDPLARGNDSAVPALLQVASQGDVILHNHPSGHLVPSEADLELAAHYGNQGVGFYIVNNSVDRVYVVVEAFGKPASPTLEVSEILQLFAPGGALAKRFSDYQHRPAQQGMAETVAETFNQSRVALIEAATGTGKSLAYLIPAILWAARNRQRVVVSTNTINLQEQLIHKDIPLLQQVLDREFNAVLVKGRSNYLCLDKLQALDRQGKLFLEEEWADFTALSQWARQTSDGSRSDLSLNVSSALWEKVACESDTCTRIKCDHYSRCFFYKARRQASAADLLVVNHHLLFADLAVRRATGRYHDAAVLPPYSRLILDEAHNVEDVATEYFGLQVSKLSLRRLLARFYRVAKRGTVREKGAIPILLAGLRSQGKQVDPDLSNRIEEHVRSRLLPELEQTSFLAEGVFNDCAAWFEARSREASAERKVRFTSDLYRQEDWKVSILARIHQLLQATQILYGNLRALDRLLTDLSEETRDALQRQRIELNALTDRLEATTVTLAEIFGTEESDKVRWIQWAPARSGKRVTFRQVPLYIGDLLRQNVFERFQTVVMTSATLTSEKRFDYLKERLGLQQDPDSRLVELALPPVFDYRRQAVLAIPTDLPYPDRSTFAEALGRFLLRALESSQGRALVLFTSYALLSRTYQRLVQPLSRLGIAALKQGDAPRHRLTGHFQRDKTSVLFATASFWEGVDVAGEALENLVLTKLPFSVPRDPVVAARVEAIRNRNGDPFLEYIVPQAVIRFRQGFGRLIRDRKDRGCILILDRRVLDKSYGRTFLDSLPDCRRVTGNSDLVLQQLREFFGTAS